MSLTINNESLCRRHKQVRCDTLTLIWNSHYNNAEERKNFQAFAKVVLSGCSIHPNCLIRLLVTLNFMFFAPHHFQVHYSSPRCVTWFPLKTSFLEVTL